VAREAASDPGAAAQDQRTAPPTARSRYASIRSPWSHASPPTCAPGRWAHEWRDKW